MTEAFRKRIYALPVPGIMELKPDEFRPSDGWFVHENNGRARTKGAYFSVRHLGEQMFIIRLR